MYVYSNKINKISTNYPQPPKKYIHILAKEHVKYLQLNRLNSNFYT